MTEAERIMREERDATIKTISDLPLSERQRDIVMALCGTIQAAINHQMEAFGHPIDPRLSLLAIGSIGSEIERLHERFVAAGIVKRSN